MTSSEAAVSSGHTKPHEEEQYLSLVRQILRTGQLRPDRTGTGTLSLFAPPSLRFSLSRPDPTDPSKAIAVLPLLTTKKVFTRGIIEELLWFVRGSTDSKLLSDKGVKIWDGNGSRQFLDKVGLGHREEGDLGPVYGFQWRHFGAEYRTAKDDYQGKGVDQLMQVVKSIKENPTDRRIILSAWNPADLKKMALPPCHMFCQFYVTLPPPNAPQGTKPLLSCLMYQRSADLGLGVPFNIASYALLVHMIALMTDTTAHEFVHQLGDAHVYKDHVEALEVQLGRKPEHEFPELRWKRTKEEIGEVDRFEASDFEIVGYKSQSAIPMKMSV
ncbi:thymidylate synthase [Microbotryum lychnidis-dioicae p1A1 Lamole]|uniref:thymidylate synthase n=2 Tax=Microbotryum TaxID=34416 RepID=U5H5G7_USTV1|nr:thymidylate synthase [Microbotryum lychnidis-dioicae p1A1 Lamole]SGY85068.1 BQ5605_C009g05737 [Microbotryum silenes-dioicae]|eukprot:KDE07135.1 thymidylate synthase [Microbotryum lychnidis-dioicae p1A1 Lamole]